VELEASLMRASGRKRRAVAAVELALLLPLLVLLFSISVDFARVFYYSQTLANCARNGAIYGSNLVLAQSPYASLQQAALADATNLSPQPTVASTTGADSAGNAYVKVTVSWDFKTITNLPGLNTVTLSRSIQMRVAP
jgi:Flp pilus assembly protein TadG